MKASSVVIVAVALLSGPLAAQENKPVPKDSVRVFIPGCAKGYIFTAGPRTPDQPGTPEIREGMHLRMNGPKKIMDEIKAQQGSMIEIIGLMKKGQYQDGVSVGHGIRISPGPAPTAGSLPPSATPSQILIDVEGWRRAVGSCPAR